MNDKNVILHIWKQGTRIKEGFNAISKDCGLGSRVYCTGLGPNTQALFHNEDGTDSLELKTLFQQECLKRGILFSGNHKVCFSHSTDDIEQTLRVYRTSMEILSGAVESGKVLDQLEGPPVEPIFRQQA
jgi:glutamate-1-semialdehyde aminotransferase